MSRSKGDIFAPAQLFTLIVSLIMTYLMFAGVAFMLYSSEVNITANVIGSVLIETPKNENTLLALLDCTNETFRIRDLLTIGVYTGSNSVSIDGKNINLKDAANASLSRLTTENYRLILKSYDTEIFRAEYGTLGKKPKYAETVIQADDKIGYLMLWSG